MPVFVGNALAMLGYGPIWTGERPSAALHRQIFNIAIFAIFHTNPRGASKVWQSLKSKWSARSKWRC
jgi:hypothetical protein